jgi:hypothetical protein
MLEKHHPVRDFLRELMPHAAWDLIKWIAGSAILASIGQLIVREFDRQPVDWIFLGSL